MAAGWRVCLCRFVRSPGCRIDQYPLLTIAKMYHRFALKLDWREARETRRDRTGQNRRGRLTQTGDEGTANFAFPGRVLPGDS